MSDPLERKIYDPATKTLTYLIAYRSITLKPLTGIEGPWEGTQTVLLAENSIKENLRVEIHAEDVYIYAGSHFQFPGQHVTLTANRIFAVGNADKGSIVFDCDGLAAGAPEPDPLSLGASGQDAQEAWETRPIDNWLGMKWKGASASAGGQGPSGNAATSVGGNGGSFVSVGTMVNLTTKPITLLARCSGKEGCMGQKGSKGGRGGKGWRYDKDEEWTMYEVPPEAIRGGNAGNGGVGGSGSRGGDAGVICASLQATSNASETGFNFVATPLGVSAGEGGKGGPGGSSGDVGDYGYFWGMVVSQHKKSDYHEGQKGDQASVGNMGNTGAKGTTGCVLHVDSNDPGTLAGILSPAHLVLILNRLWLEYHTYFTAQIYQPPGNLKNKRVQRWHQSLEWVHGSLKVFGKSPPSLATDNPMAADLLARVKTNYADKARATSVEQARRMSFAMQRSKIKRVDYYGNSINTIETPDLSIDSLKTDIRNLTDIQNNLKGVQDLLDANKKSREDLQKAAGPVLNALQSYEEDRAKLKDSLKDQETAVQQANDDLRTSKNAARLAMDNAWHFLRDQFFCTELKDLLTVLSAVGTLGGPEFQVVVDLVGKGTTIVDLYKGVDFSQFRKDLVTLEGVLIKAKYDPNKSMQKAIEAKATDILADEKAGKDFLDVLTVERNQFELQCKEYLDRKEVAEAKQSFDNLVAAAERLHTAIDQYAKLAITLMKLDADYTTAHETLEALSKSSESLSQPQLDMFLSFFAYSLATMKQRVLRKLYNAVRACNGIFLKRCSILDNLAELGSVENFDGPKLQTALVSSLYGDIEAHKQHWQSYFPTLMKDQQLTFTRADYPEHFSRMDVSGRFHLHLNPDHVITHHKFPKFWFDIRLDDFRISFISNSPPDVPEKLNLNITFGPQVLVRDEKGVSHDFVLTKPQRVAYQYSNKKEDRYKRLSAKSLKSTTHIRYTKDGKNVETAPLYSPFTQWSFGLDKATDPKSVDRVVLSLDLFVRAKEDKARQA